MMDLTNRQLAAFLSSLVVCAILVGIGVAHVELMGSPFALLVQMGGRRNQGDSMRPPPIAAAAAPLPAPHGPSSLSAKMMVVCALALLVACRDVSAPPAPLVEAGAGLAHDVCSLVEGIDDDGAIRSICATVSEIAEIVAFVTTLRVADAGAPRARETCDPLPGTTTFCATGRERAKAILFVVRARMARLTLEAATP